MEINKFLEKVKSCKKSEFMSSHLLLKIYRYSNTEIDIREEKELKVCPRCGTDLSKNPKHVRVIFNKPQGNLTVFQAGLLFDMYVYNRIPMDYANHHKSIAGMRFIENIKEVQNE